MDMKNKSQIINDSDKNQLSDMNTFFKLSLEEMEILIAKIKSELSEVVNRH